MPSGSDDERLSDKDYDVTEDDLSDLAHGNKEDSEADERSEEDDESIDDDDQQKKQKGE